MVIAMYRNRQKDFDLAKRYKLIADGVDITNRTFYADTRRRIVGTYVHNEKGKPFINAQGEIEKKWLKPRRMRLVPKA